MRTETIPLLHDHHNHPLLYAALATCPDISTLGSADGLKLLRSCPEDRLTVVQGWKSNELAFSPKELEELPPLLILNFSLHGYAVSDAALPALREKTPELVQYRDDLDWEEANVPALFAAYETLIGLSEENLVAYLDSLLPLGIGSADDMTAPTVASFTLAEKPSVSGRVSPWAAPELYRTFGQRERASCSGIKLYLDGAFGARSAAIEGPWVGGGKSFFVYDDAKLATLLKECADWGAGVAIHAIGELAIEQALRVLESLGGKRSKIPLVRLEHAQIISRDQAIRAKRLGITLSMQPNFTSDSVDYIDRMSLRYREANNPFRMLIDVAGFIPGKDLLFGSDGMPCGIAYAAQEALFPPYPGQGLSLDELVEGYGPAQGIEGSVTLEIDEERRSARVLAVKTSSATGE